MAGELHDNAEAKAFTPAGVESPRLQQTNQDMLDASHLFTSGKSAASEPASLDFGNPASLYGKDNVVAWDPKDLQKWASDRAKDIESLNPERAVFPHRGQEDKYVDYAAAKQAFNAAHLNEYPNVSPELVGAAMRNEQHFYKKSDEDQDKQVREKGTVLKADGTEDTTASIGPAQMQIGKIRELVNAIDEKTGQPKYPFLSHLKADPIRGAEDPKNAALLTAAYLAQSAEKLKAMNIDVNNQTLAYTWNPDVFKTGGRYECPSSVQLKAEHSLPSQLRPHRESVWNPTDPQILKTSTHVHNVNEQLKLIQERQVNSAH